MIFISSRRFEKSYKKLDKNIREKFKIRKDLFIQNPIDPILNIHKLSGEYDGMWSFNVIGNYRTIFDKRENEVMVFIDIGTHPELFE